MPRISKHELMLSISKLLGQRGTCPRARVGCVIELEGRILSTGYNGSLSGSPHCDEEGCLMKDGHCLRTIHAEANAICFAAKHGISLKGATLYVTGYAGGCCHACEKLALSAGIAQIISEPYYTCMSCNAKVLCTDRPKISGGKFINGGSYDFGRGTGIAPDVCKNCWSEGKRVLNHMSGVK